MDLECQSEAGVYKANIQTYFNPYFNGFRMSVFYNIIEREFEVYFNPYFNGFRMSVMSTGMAKDLITLFQSLF